MNKNHIPYLDRLKDELVRSIETRTQHAPARLSRRPRGPRLRWASLIAGASAMLVAGATAFAVLSGNGDPTPTPAPDRTSGDNPGPSLGRCVEEMTGPQSLRRREYALDGTIAAIDVPAGDDRPTLVTLRVDRWFKGGSGTSVTLKIYARPGVVSIEDGGFPLQEGARVLVSGDGDFIWDCGGFSGPYTPELASLFDEAFGV
jgi:hypothetical protein